MRKGGNLSRNLILIALLFVLMVFEGTKQRFLWMYQHLFDCCMTKV